MTRRRKLPSRRYSWTQKARVAGQVVHLGVGEFPDGTPGEVFLDCAKAGSAVRAMLNAIAIFMSLGLQHGVALKLFVDAMKGVEFEPSGVVEHSGNVREAESILDYVARELEAAYLLPTPKKEDANV